MDKHYSYKDYDIDVVEETDGSWKAHIRRTDGKYISTAASGYDKPQAVITTMSFYSVEAALEEAKRAIDGGGMK